MRVFQDVFTNDEVMGETFKYTTDFDDVIMKVQSSYKKPEQIGDVNIGCGNAFGGNEEEEGGAGEEGGETVIDVVYNYNLAETFFSKNEFVTYIKAYLKKLKEYLESNGQTERVDAFMKGAQNFIKKVVSDFNEYQFFTGVKESLDGGIILAYWEDPSGEGPVFYYFMDGLKEVKY